MYTVITENSSFIIIWKFQFPLSAGLYQYINPFDNLGYGSQSISAIIHLGYYSVESYRTVRKELFLLETVPIVLGNGSKYSR